MPTAVSLPQCINTLFNGLVIKLKSFLEILLTSLHQQSQILMNELGAYQGKSRRKISLKLPIMKFHRSKQSVLMKSFNG